MLAPSPQPTQRFGKYLLVERLGRGGMAEVWKAKILGPAGFQRTVVVKRILPHLAEDPHFVQMFVSEARLSARLSHANIVHVYELGDVDGEYFICMEYVRGRDVVSVMRAHLMRAVPPPGLGAFVVREVCRALAYAHALTDDDGRPLRLIHRDVSPSNVMLSFDGSVKLLDFGIAKALSEASENKTQTGTLKGKFGYMSPEQVEGKEIDHRTDLFAAGIVLHEILTGRRLFKGQTDIQTIAMVREANIQPPSVFNPQVSPELDRVVMKALARDPTVRYQRCDEMAYDLDSVVHTLKWGAERVAGMLKELFPDEPSGTGQVVVPSEELPASVITTGQPQKKKRQRQWTVAAVAAAGVLSLAVLIPALRQHPVVPPPPATVPVAAPPQTTKPPPAPAPAMPAEVAIRVSSTPPDAEVLLTGDERPRGVTPLKLSLPRASTAIQVTVRKKGFQEQKLDASLNLDSNLVVTLTPEAAAPPVPKPARPIVRRPAVERPKPKPAGPDLKKGDVVDPFANP
jgi:eukaryotic-like serine/threonine-protein kinase